MSELYKKIKQITIVGAGSWGTAVGKVIAENNPGIIVRMWAYEKATANSINLKNQNSEFLPGIQLPYNIKATTNLADSVANTEGVIIAIPSKVFPDMIQKISKLLKNDEPLAYLTKGFCKINNNALTISQTVSKLFPKYGKRVVGIYGPSHAEEVVKYFHTTLCVAGHDKNDRRFFADLLNCGYIQCRETDDIIGVDLGGTLKNPAAIAAGVISKLPDCGNNLEGALISESLKEMIRLGNFFGARPETIIDISGTGDLVATALSMHSRNRKFGREIAKQIIEKGAILSWIDKIYLRFKPEYVLEKMSNKMHYLVEGAYAIEPLIELAHKNNISIPVYRSLYEVLLNKKEPSLLIETIKNPDNFENIYSNAKIHVKDKKKGLEALKGKAFEKIILNQLVAKLKAENSLLNNSKSLKNLLKNQSEDVLFFENENKLYSEFAESNSEKSLKRIIRLYLRETIDRYSPFFYHLCDRLFSAKYFWYKLFRKKNVTITGFLNEFHNLNDSGNTIYIARSKNINDFIYYLYAMKKNNLALTRFLVPADMLKSRLDKFLVRKCGGFIIYREKLNNMLYLECIIEYLSMLAKHGVPFIFFPELFTSEPNNLDLNKKFFNMLNDIMYNEATEIVLIPLEIAYKKRVDESEFRKVFTEPVSINFSAPIFLSEFTKESSTEISIFDLVKKIWIADEILFSHHIISGILCENDFAMKTSKLKKVIGKFIADHRIIIDRSEKSIINEGVKFLLKNEILVRKDDHYIVLKQDLIKKFSDVIKNKNSSSRVNK